MYQDAPILDPAEHGTKWPLVIFSHGLGGSPTTYSQFCTRLAASGRVVVSHLKTAHISVNERVTGRNGTSGWNHAFVYCAVSRAGKAPIIYQGKRCSVRINWFDFGTANIYSDGLRNLTILCLCALTNSSSAKMRYTLHMQPSQSLLVAMASAHPSVS